MITEEGAVGMMLFGVLFIALGLLAFYQGAHDHGALDRQEIIQKYREAGEMFDKATAIYNEALKRYPK